MRKYPSFVVPEPKLRERKTEPLRPLFDVLKKRVPSQKHVSPFFLTHQITVPEHLIG